MELGLKETGTKTRNTAMANRLGEMVANTLATISEDKETARVPSNQRMELTLASSLMTSSAVGEIILGLMVESTRGNGKITRCGVKVSSHGLKEESTSETMSMI